MGNTDPSFVARSLVQHGSALPRALLLGRLLAVEASEEAYVRKRFAAQAAAFTAAERRVGEAVEKVLRRAEMGTLEDGRDLATHDEAPTGVGSQGEIVSGDATESESDERWESVGTSTRANASAHTHRNSSSSSSSLLGPSEAASAHSSSTTGPSSPLPPSSFSSLLSQPGSLSFFRLDARQCFLVDGRGGRAAVPLPPLRSAASDPLGPLSLALLHQVKADS